MSVMTLSALITPAYAVGGDSKIHLVPTLHESQFPDSFLDACLNLGSWPKVRSQTSLLGAVDHRLSLISDTDLQNCFSGLNSYGIEFSLETGVIGAFTTGEDAFNTNKAFFDRALNLGGPLTTLYVDEPLNNGLNHTSLTYSQIVSETVDWLDLIRQNYPGMKVILMEAYPSSSASTLISFFSDINSEASGRSVAGLDGFTIDHDMNQSGWTWNAISSIQSAVQNASMDFGVIFWGGGNTSSNCTYLNNTVDMAAAYVANGIVPDIYKIESWDEYPTDTLPEPSGTAVQCTFMATAAFIIFDATIYDAFGYSVSLGTVSGVHYVVAEGNGNDVVNADRTSIGAWETFKLLDLNGGALFDGDPVAFVTSSGWYFRAENAGAMWADEVGVPVQRQVFTLHNVSDPSGQIEHNDVVALQSYDGYYAAAELGGGDTVNVNRTAIGSWEQFTLIMH